MAKELDQSDAQSTKSDVDAFLKKVALTPKAEAGAASGRLLFAIDATASRQPTWDNACQIQCEMFEEASKTGKLAMQVAFFRGFGEFKATPWTENSDRLIRPMSRVQCLGGHTQIRKVLKHAIRNNEQSPINAVVYVGDCMEEDADELCHLAGQLGITNTPLFIFQEGHDPIAENCFRQMCRLSKGAFFRFDQNSVASLRKLLKAVAVFAVGGRKALQDYGKKEGGDILLLSQQLK
ncbi:VWA domain-containing protein [Sneathiella limimaris]|uniref:VWA domain-containing protein n=1 Tax=Sneathiella limimaris TaxID=1964213 RepID=UPI00146A768F|nr:VWA domain-containing protein [Sneathiella limimaris]